MNSGHSILTRVNKYAAQVFLALIYTSNGKMKLNYVKTFKNETKVNQPSYKEKYVLIV